MNRVLVETQYLPSLEFFCAVSIAGEIQIEFYEHYIRQSYRNHALINTSNGIHKMIVPLTSKRNHTLVKDLKIDRTQNWVNNQRRTIESAYRKSPYYEHYADELMATLNKPHTFLVDLNTDLLSLCLRWLSWPKEISSSRSFQVEVSGWVDLRNVLLSKKPYRSRAFYRPHVYTQVFGQKFAENLSVVDLIFCKGPEAGSILQASIPRNGLAGMNL